VDRLYTLKEAKKLLGVQTETIQRWDAEGKLGGKSSRRWEACSRKRDTTGTGRGRRGKGESPGARVSSPSQKDDLERRAELIRSRGVEEVLTDGGSGLNDGEAEPREATKNGDQEKRGSRIVFSYPDRLTRFGFETLRELFSAFGTKIMVLNENQHKSPQERWKT